jgi:hypothetical protein
MSEHEADYFLTFLLREDGKMQVGGMTLEWIALALTDKTKVTVRVNTEFDCSLVGVLIPLSLYEYVADKLDFDEAECDESLEEQEEEGLFDHNCYVVTMARLDDGRNVEIAIPYWSLEELVDQEEECVSVDIDYRTRFDLGKETCFRDLFVPLAVGIELGVIPPIFVSLS